MKLLQITASGLPLFKKDLFMTFYAKQRVDELDKRSMFSLDEGSKFFLNCSNALIGVNASGKTSALKVILLALDLLNNEPISHSETRDILGNAQNVMFRVNFLSDIGELCQLETYISAARKGSERIYRIGKETLWVKPLSAAKTKKGLVDFADIEPHTTRDATESYLPDDVSIIIAYNKKQEQQTSTASLLSMTNVNVLPVSDEIPAAVIRFLDPTIEKLSFEHNEPKVAIHLKFKGEKEVLLSDPAELNRYLSSGTIKGIVTFTLAIRALKDGGYLVIDELENHFNKEIASTLLRFFNDSTVNKKGGVLIFSTHYAEILDEFERNDCIFITRNRSGITVDNLNDILTRNDLKKSEVYQSGFLEGTVPVYEAYMELKKSIQSSLSEEG